MIRNVALASAMLVALAAPAFADCAEDVTKVQQALEAAKVSDDDKTVITAAIEEATKNAGNEEACAAAVAEAKSILGLE